MGGDESVEEEVAAVTEIAAYLDDAPQPLKITRNK